MKHLAVMLILLLPPICMGAQVVKILDAPDTNISGLAWGDGKLWALDAGSSYIYGINPATGAVEESFYVNQSAGTSPVATGLAYQGGTLFVASVAGTSTYIYFYSSTGSYLGYDSIC